MPENLDPFCCCPLLRLQRKRFPDASRRNRDAALAGRREQKPSSPTTTGGIISLLLQQQQQPLTLLVVTWHRCPETFSLFPAERESSPRRIYYFTSFETNSRSRHPNLSFSLSLFLSFSLSHFLSFSLSHFLSFSLSHFLSLSLFLCFHRTLSAGQARGRP